MTAGMVRLRTGQEVTAETFEAAMENIIELFKANALSAQEAVLLARDPNYRLWGKHGDVVADFGLVTDGVMHDTVRQIILAATEGDGLDMHLVDPRAPAN